MGGLDGETGAGGSPAADEDAFGKNLLIRGRLPVTGKARARIDALDPGVDTPTVEPERAVGRLEAVTLQVLNFAGIGL